MEGRHSGARFRRYLWLSSEKPQKIIVCEPGEYRLEQDLIKLSAESHIRLAIKDDLYFMCSRADFKRWAANGKQLRMEFFYRVMRKKYNVLMQGGEPEGGAWNYDTQNRKAFRKTGPKDIPRPPRVTIDRVTQQVMDTVEQHFPDLVIGREQIFFPIHN